MKRMVQGRVGSLITFNGQGDVDRVYAAKAVLGFGPSGGDMQITVNTHVLGTER